MCVLPELADILCETHSPRIAVHRPQATELALAVTGLFSSSA